MEKTGYNRWVEIEKEANEAISFSRTAFATLKARDAPIAAILRLLVVIVKILIHSHKQL